LEILAPIGAGGMGEVYRARDTKLNRDVALKVLPREFALDPDRLARFKREAQVLASLNHPHIAAIHGLEESAGVQALILELVDGETLADRVARGPILLDEALTIAQQIAEALEAAHEHGIIHRDLKPANIRLRPDGTVKVLDFGLAKSVEQTSAPSDRAQSPTVLSPVPTLAGVILGTATYMSPEQARGKPVDKRTDVWAFGCVLFEMMTARKPFDGETLTDIVAAIVKNEPDWRALPPGTPAAVQAVLARCLRKDPAERLRDIADGRFQIEDVLNDLGASPAAVIPARTHREWAGWIAAVLFLGAALFFAARPSITSSPGDPISIPVFPPEKAAFSGAINTTVNVPSFALAPDGHALVFSAEAAEGRPMLWVRSLDRADARQLAGTEDAQDPMWSPDSRWIGFFADGKLKKIPAAGGAVQVITQTSADFRGGTWGPEDTILFGLGAEPIQRVDAAGGKATPVTIIDASRQEGTHRNPHLLPDGRHFLYSIFGGTQDQNGVYVGSLDGKTKKLLVNVHTNAVYAPPGHLLFVDGDTLLGQGFDAERLELEGQPFPVAEHVGRNTAFVGAVSASRTGIIAYADTITQNGRLTWIDRKGNPLGSTSTPEGDYIDFRLSPDEPRLVASLVDPKTNIVEVWLSDLTRSSTARVSSGGLVTASAFWSPDGTQLMFRSNRNGIIEFFQRSAAGGGNDRLVLAGAQMPSLNLIPTDWSPDGRNIIFSAPAPESANDLWLWPVAGEGKPTKLIASPGNQMHGNFSPDGGLVAYTSSESGKFEVYVETVPRSDRKWSVSTNGGYEPRWRADGREIYYLSEDRKLMAVTVGAGPSFGIPQPLFHSRVPAGVMALRTHYVPSRDGQRFLVNVAHDAAASPITVVLNWTATPKK
jgi:serine/threonine protein kinase/Tol biopolymer transport system component